MQDAEFQNRLRVMDIDAVDLEQLFHMLDDAWTQRALAKQRRTPEAFVFWLAGPHVFSINSVFGLGSDLRGLYFLNS